ncbi:hypothetical protein C8Q78DRAFT_487811 [Trametes maxima]|nr:hypothetical protein C8Q78DRAFT_487811 [Trametes maxima]
MVPPAWCVSFAQIGCPARLKRRYRATKMFRLQRCGWRGTGGMGSMRPPAQIEPPLGSERCRPGASTRQCYCDGTNARTLMGAHGAPLARFTLSPRSSQSPGWPRPCFSATIFTPRRHDDPSTLAAQLPLSWIRMLALGLAPPTCHGCSATCPGSGSALVYSRSPAPPSPIAAPQGGSMRWTHGRTLDPHSIETTYRIRSPRTARSIPRIRIRTLPCHYSRLRRDLRCSALPRRL